jgi:hypothetical protein
MAGVVHVVVFSNFEGWSQPQAAPQAIVDWFTALSQTHPQMRWTHLYNPYHLIMKRPEAVATEAIYSPYLLELQKSGMAEVGLHIHLFYDMVSAMGVVARGTPFAFDVAPDCDTPRNPDEDMGPNAQGYDVLMTGYSEAERATILDVSIGAFLCRGFGRPKTYCASFAAIDPSFQALLVARGFTTSMSMQAPPPGAETDCWAHEIAGRITPQTRPYRVNRSSILPPPHDDPTYLPLVELPLNMGVDNFDIYDRDGCVVSREAMFDWHYDWARTNNAETMVAIGVHADVIPYDPWPTGPVAQSIDRFLRHVARRAQDRGPVVRYGTASQVAAHF